MLAFSLNEGNSWSIPTKAWNKRWGCLLSSLLFYLCWDIRFIRRRQWHPTEVLLLGKSHGLDPGRLQSMGSLRVGHDWATSLSLFTLVHWRRNGNPLQCSCLENPRDGGAWWAAVYGVAQSQTQLKQLSSSIRFIQLEKKKKIVVQKLENKWSNDHYLQRMWLYILKKNQGHSFTIW